VDEDLIFPNFLELVVKPVATVDGGYAIIYANTTKTPTDDIFLPKGGIYAIFLKYGQKFNRQQVVLYQTQISGLKFSGLNCDIAYVGFGQICILTGKFEDRRVRRVRPVPTTFFIRVDFLSSGTLYKVQSLNATATDLGVITEYKIRSLRYGGYILMGIGNLTNLTNDANQLPIYGHIINDDGGSGPWNLTNPIMSNFNFAYIILTNNTFVLSQPEVEQSWTLITTDLYQFAGALGKVTRTRKKKMNQRFFNMMLHKLYQIF